MKKTRLQLKSLCCHDGVHFTVVPLTLACLSWGVVMKIHEKILTHYLSCPSPVDKQGYLYKKERPADRHLLGVIFLEGCVVQPGDSEGQYCFSLVFAGPGLRTYTFAAEDLHSQQCWVAALLSASHRYLSHLVKDLGRLYDEAKRGSGESSQVCAVNQRQLSQSMALFHVSSPYYVQGTRAARVHTPNHAFQAPSVPFKTSNKRSPKMWPKRNALVTPLNGPAPPNGEWPLLGSDPLVDFCKLHEHYGSEVKQLRADWLRRKREEQQGSEEDLIDLG
ncbi:sesquipedalian-1 isoform X2 [Denticeps clupeoides]|uniref:sesquipedalian-1 isoform X2 n=1 Tax=Denticeps clupeoides TaxID=299321 RepID=UPI0010A2F4F1|nr:sesquipedalian-1-like isoform X2 [Denticeps clupeoides]